MEQIVLVGSDKKKKSPIFRDESRLRRLPIQASHNDPKFTSILDFPIGSDLREAAAVIYKSNVEDRTSNKLSHLRPVLESKGSNVIQGSSTGVMTGNDIPMASLSPILCANPQIRHLRSQKIERARSLEKPGRDGGLGTKYADLCTTRNRQFNALNSKKQHPLGFWERQFQPPFRTEVIARGSKQVQPRETRPHKEGGVATRPSKMIPRNLTELLQEMNNSGDSISMNMEDEEEFDFDKESKKCEDQISQIKDAYVVDLPDLNGDKELGPMTLNQDAALESKAGDDPDKQGSSSVFKKIAYFTSVAATTGFYFLMRRHQIL